MNTPKKIVGVGEYDCFHLNNGQLFNVTSGTPVKVSGQPAIVTDVKANLHHQILIDDAANLYCWGDESAAIMGNNVQTPTKVLDAKGSPITNVKKAIPYSSQGQGILSLKKDGSVWVCGNTQGGMRGDGTTGGSADTPVPVPLPGGTIVTDICASTIAMALDSNGNVWTWGDAGEFNVANMLGQGNPNADPTRPGKVVLPVPAVQIAGGGYFNYALLKDGRLAGWTRIDPRYLGLATTSAQPNPFVLSLGFPAAIAAVFVNHMASFVILTDGSLWAWGDNACGCCGNGVEIDYSTYVTPYYMNIDLQMGLPQVKPVQIGAGVSFVDVKSSVKYCMYAIAEDVDGNLYAWGRNKGGVHGNGVIAADGFIGALASNYPNSWDVPYITPINPFALAAPKPTTSLICIKNPGTVGCPVIATPAASLPLQVSAGANQTIWGNAVQLQGSASGGAPINYWMWKLISGPGSPLIILPTSQNPKVTGLQSGTYVFQLSATDSNWKTATRQVTITVTGVIPPPPPAAPRKVASMKIVISGVLTPVALTGAQFTFDDGSTQ